MTNLTPKQIELAAQFAKMLSDKGVTAEQFAANAESLTTQCFKRQIEISNQIAARFESDASFRADTLKTVMEMCKA